MKTEKYLFSTKTLKVGEVVAKICTEIAENQIKVSVLDNEMCAAITAGNITLAKEVSTKMHAVFGRTDKLRHALEALEQL